MVHHCNNPEGFMKTAHHLRPGIIFVLLAVLISALACGLPAMAATPAFPVAVTNAANASQQSMSPTGPIPIPSIPAAEQASSNIPTATPVAATSTPTATTTITHRDHPGTPPYRTSFMWDSDSSTTAAQHRPKGGDNFDLGLFERPFNANTQDQYFPSIDIQQASLSIANPWIYSAILLKGPDSSSNVLDASYAVELDLNLDGRGDYLVLVNAPNSKDWSTEGVQIWHDADHDIGGTVPVKSDPVQLGNGYEELVFDQGKGGDPDLAWARISSTNPNEVWIAFKTSVIQGSEKFMWGAWAQRPGLHPEAFDYNDHFNLDQAGSPLPEVVKYYPLKALAEVDNTCRWPVGFNPVGNEPGICPLPPTPTVPPPPTPVPTKKVLIQLPTHAIIIIIRKTPTRVPIK
jgi:hypothetical protein